MMEDFNFRRLAAYLLSLRFEILAAIEHEARRVDHPPSRRIGRRALAEHDMTICAVVKLARDHGASLTQDLEQFYEAAKSNMVPGYGIQNVQEYYLQMRGHGLTDAERDTLVRDDCPCCGRLWINAMARRCDCPPEERMAALRRQLGFDDVKK